MTPRKTSSRPGTARASSPGPAADVLPPDAAATLAGEAFPPSVTPASPPSSPSSRAPEGSARAGGAEDSGEGAGSGTPPFPGNQPRIVGLDLSLTSTGIARISEDTEFWRVMPKGPVGCDRLNIIAREVMRRCRDADLVVIEGPSYGSKGGREHERGGLWWLIRYFLWETATDVAVVPPATLKRYATGKGNAGKDQVLAAVIRRYPLVPVDGNDVADALVLAAMGADQLGWPLADVPQLQRGALAKVEWPVLAGFGSPP